jgi:hypothetical protein
VDNVLRHSHAEVPIVSPPIKDMQNKLPPVRLEVLTAVSMKISVFWVVASVIWAMNIHRPDDGGSMISDTLVNIDHTTQRNNPEDGNLHTHRCENLKSYK